MYQINGTANTLSALLQTQVEQKEKFKAETEQAKKEFEQEISTQKTYWQEQKEQLEGSYKEQKGLLEKTRKREEEEYIYALELKRRKETDDYNNKRILMEKELSELQDNLLKREEAVKEKEESYEFLKIQVDQIPDKIKEAVVTAEESLRDQLLQKHEFETTLKTQEYDGVLKLKEQNIYHLEEKIKRQEAMIKEFSEKADMATSQVQSIACRALDTSAARFVTVSSGKTEEKNV